jgi:hypothetical protein
MDKDGQRILIDRALDRNRLKNYVGSQLREENMKVSQINKEHIRSKNTSKVEQTHFPTTTNNDFHSEGVHSLSKPVDKSNFKKHNVFAAYVNAQFNSGVFNNPWQDQC